MGEIDIRVAYPVTLYISRFSRGLLGRHSQVETLESATKDSVNRLGCKAPQLIDIFSIEPVSVPL